jgi:hypothetical protein
MVLLAGGLSAWKARRRRAAADAARISSGWRGLPDPHGALHPSVWDLTVLNLGYNRVLSAATATTAAGGERDLIETGFDSGFGEMRRHYRYAAIIGELPEAPRAMVITHDPILAAAAMRPGFVSRRSVGMEWIADDAGRIDAIERLLADWLREYATTLTVEFRSGIIAICQPGVLNAKSQAALIDAADSIMERLATRAA